MLGYGGTSRPTRVEEYKYSLVCGDIVDIMDAEKVQKGDRHWARLVGRAISSSRDYILTSQGTP
jgi:hypothetical protein